MGTVSTWSRGVQTRVDGRPGLLLALVGARHPDVVSADQLTDALWPDGASRTALHVLVGRLRRAFDEEFASGIRHEGDGYRLACSSTQLDTAIFERRVSVARTHRTAAALDSARQEFTNALDMWGEPFGQWADHPALIDATSALRELHLAVEEELTDVVLDLGDHETCIDRLVALAEAQPLRERRWEQLMTALYRNGRQADALRCAQRARDVLGEEVGLDVGPGLVALERAILDHEPSLVGESVPTAPRLRMPSAPTSFIGRDVECRELRDIIATHRLVTVWGPGGIGKSRMAIQVVGQLDGELRNGATVVPLAARNDFAGVLSQIGLAIGVTRHDHHDLEPIVGHLRDRECVIVLDNCEHLGSYLATVVARLLAECTGVRVVATSQRPLGVLGEHRWQLRQMSMSTGDAPADAESLFMERAEPPPGGWEAGGTGAAIVALCRRLDGLPLALELAAARTPTLGAAEILQRLDRRFDVLRTDASTAQPHHRTLLTTIEWSHGLLSWEAASLLERLSIFAGAFTIDDVEAVCCDVALPVDDVLRVIDELVSHSLLHVTMVGSSTGFRLFESIREFGSDRLEPFRRLRLRLAHRARFAQLAKDLGRLVLVDDGESVARLAAAGDDIRSAVDGAMADGDTAAVLDAGNELISFWMLQGWTTWGRSRLESALPATDELDLRQAKALRAAAILAAFDGDNASAEAHLVRARTTFEAIGSPRQVAWTRFWFGRFITAAVFAGTLPAERLAEAGEHHRFALEAFRRLDDVVAVVMIGPFAGLCFVLLEDPAGVELIMETHETAMALGGRRHVAITGAMHAMCLARNGQHRRALGLLDHAVRELGELGDHLNESISGALRAHVLLALELVPEACQQAARTIEVHQRHGDREWEPYVLGVARITLDQLGGDSARRLGDRLDLLMPSWSQPLRLAAIGDFDLPPPVSSVVRPAVGQVAELASSLTLALSGVVGGSSG